MIKFQNVTTEGQFHDFANHMNLNVQEMQLLSVKPETIKGKSAWLITEERYGHREYMLTIDKSGNCTLEYTVQTGDTPFSVDLHLHDDFVDIIKANERERNIRADRLLKKYMQIATFASCLIMYGYCGGIK